MKNAVIAVLALLAVCMPANAQKNKKKVAAKKTVVAKKPPIVEPEEDPKVTKMLEATQDIVFIDSVVVSKEEFLSNYYLNGETGKVMTYNSFFRSDKQPYSTVYLNQLGNKCYFSENGRLYTSDMLGNSWSEPSEIKGIGDFNRANYPFVMADGTTLYFAAIGPEGLGGLDIYVTRYDSSTGNFLKAENIGMPFNSDANDYMYVIDEIESIGYFATDRRQPEGKVCIYTFIPNHSRSTYSPDEYEEEIIRSRAAIDRIRDTWGDGQARNAALERLARLKAAPKTTEKKAGQGFSFIVDDNLVYTSLSDFRSAGNRERAAEWQKLTAQQQELTASLEKARAYYHAASSAERNSLKREILGNEQKEQSLQATIKKLEKTIRNEELKTLKKK